MNNAVEVLKKAKELIEKHGWIQRAGGDCERGFCMSEAVWQASLALKETALTPFAARYAIYTVLNSPIVPWNDTTGRTKKEVLAKFDEAIALVEKEAAEEAAKEPSK